MGINLNMILIDENVFERGLKLVEHCTGIAEVRVRAPLRPSSFLYK